MSTQTENSFYVGSIVPLTLTNAPDYWKRGQQQVESGLLEKIQTFQISSSNTTSTCNTRNMTIMQELKTANLAQMSLDDLLCLEVMADMLGEKYVSYALPCPDWLKKRNREIRRATIVAIEKEVEAVEAELKELEAKETRREAAKDKLAQLQKAMKSK